MVFAMCPSSVPILDTAALSKYSDVVSIAILRNTLLRHFAHFSGLLYKSLITLMNKILNIGLK